MIQKLDVFVNDPFEAGLLKDLFQNKEDLKLCNPFASFPFQEKEWKEKFAEHPDNCSLIFQIEGKIIGHTSFLPKEDDMYLCFVILHQDYRGQNYAQELIRESEEFCRLNYSNNDVYLNVSKSNERAIKLYKKMGYETCIEHENKFQMKKRLR